MGCHRTRPVRFEGGAQAGVPSEPVGYPSPAACPCRPATSSKGPRRPGWCTWRRHLALCPPRRRERLAQCHSTHRSAPGTTAQDGRDVHSHPRDRGPAALSLVAKDVCRETT